MQIQRRVSLEDVDDLFNWANKWAVLDCIKSLVKLTDIGLLNLLVTFSYGCNDVFSYDKRSLYHMSCKGIIIIFMLKQFLSWYFSAAKFSGIIRSVLFTTVTLTDHFFVVQLIF